MLLILNGETHKHIKGPALCDITKGWCPELHCRAEGELGRSSLFCGVFTDWIYLLMLEIVNGTIWDFADSP